MPQQTGGQPAEEARLRSRQHPGGPRVLALRRKARPVPRAQVKRRGSRASRRRVLAGPGEKPAAGQQRAEPREEEAHWDVPGRVQAALDSRRHVASLADSLRRGFL